MRSVVIVAATPFTFKYTLHSAYPKPRGVITLDPDEDVTEEFTPFLRWTAFIRSNLRPIAESPWKNADRHARRHST